METLKNEVRSSLTTVIALKRFSATPNNEAKDINTPEKQYEGREAPKLLATRTLYVAIRENRHILNPLISLLPNIVAQLVWSRLLDRHLSHHKNDWDESQSPCVA
jgi:hypothetical protein